jgi:peptidoglycan hydrolase-like amidase
MRPNETQLVDTVYSANCGGHSEDNEHVWPSPADLQLRATADPDLPEQFAKGIDRHQRGQKTKRNTALGGSERPSTRNR